MLGLEGLGQLFRRVDLIVDGEAGLAGVEGGQLLRTVADDGHAVGLEVLERQAEVQNGLCTGADDHNGRGGQLFKVGRDVHGRLGTAMHAADAAGGEHLDAGHVGDDHRGGDGRCAVFAAGAQDSQIAAGGLGDGGALLAEVLDLLFGQTGLQTAADDGDGRGDGAVLTDDALDLQGGLHILRIGHAVGDDGGFQSDDGLTGGNGLGDLGLYVKKLVELHDKDPPVSRIENLQIYSAAMRLRTVSADMAGLMVSSPSMAIAAAAAAARAVSASAVPSR